MTYHNNILCVPYNELINSGLITISDYINYTNRKKITVVRRGCRGTEALVAFESLPPTIQTKLREKHVDLETQAKLEPIKKLLVQDYNAYNFFSSFVLPNGENLKANTIREYTSTAIALNAIIKLTEDSKSWRKALGAKGRKASFKDLIELMNQLQNKWGWKLPTSERGLRGKISAYKAFKYESLISGKLCNDNAAKVVESEQEAALRRIMAMGMNWDNVQVRDYYNIMAEQVGWKKLSEGTVANKRKDWQIYVDAGSRGEQHHDNTHAMQVKRRAPKMPMLYWTTDGWDVELLYQETITDRKGYLNTTYHNRLTTVIVLDPCQNYPIGYAIGTHETPELIRQALRNAIKHTEQLFGRMHHVHQLQTDRYGKGTLTPFYEALSNVYTPARAKNAKAKVIEPYFKRINKKYCQLLSNWSGFGVTSRKENQPNPETLNKIRKTFPDRAGVEAQIHRIIELERAQKIEAYKASFELLPTEKLNPWTREQYLLNLGETNRRGDTVRLVGSGVNMQFNKQHYAYESFDLAFRKHRNVDWILRYDPEDMDTVLATNADASLRYMLSTQYVQPMALAERTEADSGQLQSIRAYNKNLKQNILDVQAQDYQALQGLAEQHPALEDTLNKLLIVDSNGQHKNNKAIARLNRTERLIEIKEERQCTKSKAQLQQEYIKSKLNTNDYL